MESLKLNNSTLSVKGPDGEWTEVGFVHDVQIKLEPPLMNKISKSDILQAANYLSEDKEPVTVTFTMERPDWHQVSFANALADLEIREQAQAKLDAARASVRKRLELSGVVSPTLPVGNPAPSGPPIMHPPCFDRE